jgi:hypothetical protein
VHKTRAFAALLNEYSNRPVPRGTDPLRQGCRGGVSSRRAGINFFKETVMAEKIRYSDRRPENENAPVSRGSNSTKTVTDPADGAVQSSPKRAEEGRRVLEEKAKDGLKNATGQLPRDQI